MIQEVVESGIIHTSLVVMPSALLRVANNVITPLGDTEVLSNCKQLTAHGKNTCLAA